MNLALIPVSQRRAFDFISIHHRHHLPPRGALFCIGAERDGCIVGVAVIGRPVARQLQDGFTAEVTRLCTDGTPEAKNAASMLYAAAWRAARAMGYHRLITYTLQDETGVSVASAGWKAIYQTRGGTWDRPGRARVDTHPTCAKTLWEAPV